MKIAERLRRMFPRRYWVNVIKLRGLERYEVCSELHETKEAALKKAMSFGDARAYTWVATLAVWSWRRF